jgi:hypothetical protein
LQKHEKYNLKNELSSLGSKLKFKEGPNVENKDVKMM